MTDEKFECIYKQYEKLVMNAAYEILHDYHLAQDVCQEVFIKVSNDRLESLATDEDMKRYLNYVAGNRAIDYYRKLRRMNEVSLEDQEDAMNCLNMDEKVYKEEFVLEMFKALEVKKPEWKEIVLRVGFYDEPPIIVARDMGI